MDNVFIGLGSNLENPLSQLKQAITHIKKTNGIELEAVSHFYSSQPMGPQDQPDFINAVINISTSLEPELLLDELQRIENEQGRVRKERWGARTLDLDILLYGKEVIISERLTVPHSGISERNFVLYPLQDLVSGDFMIPNKGTISELIANCPEAGIKRISES